MEFKKGKLSDKNVFIKLHEKTLSKKRCSLAAQFENTGEYFEDPLRDSWFRETKLLLPCIQ